jgi:hypothetical protein
VLDHRIRVARRATCIAVLLVVAAPASAACADAPSGPVPLEGPWTPSPDIATRAVLTCAEDGTTSLSAETIQPRPDGVHIKVVNAYDEPVSVEGFDAEPGVTDWVFSRGPGTMELMCWPFSQHGSGDEPARIPLRIVDPLGLYVDGSLPCEDDIRSFTTVDYFEPPIDEGPPPLEVARRVIEGLRADDILRVDGYPEQEGGAVIVIREGAVVGRYGISRFEGEPWTITSGSACEGTGLPFEGESYG